MRGSDGRAGAVNDALNDYDWRDVVRSIEATNCVLMLGPGAVTDTNGVPISKLALEFLAEQVERQAVSSTPEGEESGTSGGEPDDSWFGKSKRKVGQARGYAKRKIRRSPDEQAAIEPPPPASASGRPLRDRPSAEVAQAFYAQTPRPNVLTSLMTDFYAAQDLDVGVLRTLATLPFRWIISTVPVTPPIEDALVLAGKEPQSYHYDYTRGEQQIPSTPTIDQPVVYQLFGSVENQESLVLSEKGQLDFLVAAVSEKPPLPTKLTADLRLEKTSFLFLGFDLHRWNLRVLIHWLLGDSRRQNWSFALESTDVPDDRDTGLFYYPTRSINLITSDISQFVVELAKRVDPQVARRNERAEEPRGETPVAFLCHASEDAATAKRLATELPEKGIQPWLDADNLRGGDRWDDRIRHVIDREVEQVVVIHSQHLADAHEEEAYVNSEIRAALRRQERFPKGGFIVPVTVDDAELRDDLRDIQAIDLSDWGSGVAKLVRSLKRGSDKVRKNL